MDFSALYESSVTVKTHLGFALSAFVLGGVQLIYPKGTFQHKVFGRLWVFMMFAICATSFWIKGLMPGSIFWGYSPIHLLSLFVLIQIFRGVYYARIGKIDAHRKSMTYTYFGGLLIAGAFTFYPGRLLYSVLIG